MASSITFPYTPTAVYDKRGGKITSIDHITHEVAKPKGKRSQDVWYFRGRVEWNDGTVSETTYIYPYNLCYHSEEPIGEQEIHRLSSALNDYLTEHGEWHRTGPHEGWYANKR